MKDYALALKKIGNAFLIFVFNINIGTINILPNFLGYIFIIQALKILEKYEQSIQLMKPLTISITIYSGVIWIFNIFGFNMDIYFLGLIFSIISIYIYYHLLTSISQICELYDSKYTNKIEKLRNIIVIMQTVFSFVNLILEKELADYLVFIVIIYIIIVIYMKLLLNKCAKEAEII